MADVLRLLSHIAQPPTTSLFPYTTLFRSRREERRVDRHVEVRHARRVRADRRGRDERVELPRAGPRGALRGEIGRASCRERVKWSVAVRYGTRDAGHRPLSV